MTNLVIYNHGKDSSPWGEKTAVFAAIAERLGFQFVSPDYRGEYDPDARVEQLLALERSAFDKIVLVGSSMGGYVATVASPAIRPKGLFLLAPAVYLPGYGCSEFNPSADLIRVFHGWRDVIVPPDHVWRFCARYRLALSMVDADHRLMEILPQLADEFTRFLTALK
jgi:pimeloyl-ACP methyl ester carboxylesterase